MRGCRNIEWHFVESQIWSLCRKWITWSKITWSKTWSKVKNYLTFIAEQVRLLTKWSNLTFDKLIKSDFWQIDQIRLSTKWSNLTFDEVIKFDFRRTDQIWLSTKWSNLTFDEVPNLFASPSSLTSIASPHWYKYTQEIATSRPPESPRGFSLGTPALMDTFNGWSHFRSTLWLSTKWYSTK